MTDDYREYTHYFLYDHNEPPAIRERYTFTAAIAGHDQPVRQASVNAGTYFPIPTHPDARFFRFAGGLSSTVLPAVVFFQMPLREGEEVLVSASDGLQSGPAAEVMALECGFIHCYTGEPLSQLPLLPSAPRLWVRPLTYEVRTSDTRFAAACQIAVESFTGLRPSLCVNGQRVTFGEPLAGRACQPVLWDFPDIRVPVAEDTGLQVQASLAEYGKEPTTARYLFDPLRSPGRFGYELVGDSLTYSDLPGGRTPAGAYAGVCARMVVPVVSRRSMPPVIEEMEVLAGGRSFRVPAAGEVRTARTVELYDKRGKLSPYFMFEVAATSAPMLFVNSDRPLSPEAVKRRFFPLLPGDAVVARIVGADDSSPFCATVLGGRTIAPQIGAIDL
ncbi:MAG: hypothetical protein LLG01_01705 [Planctomycetaceae bacterium]|nr:hypothetical protein [Planctomycetaceae bacterium]